MSIEDDLRDGDKGLVERLSDARTVLAIVALVLYAVLRVAYGRFYSPFGLTPDDLGLGYLELLAQSALGATVLLTVFWVGGSIVAASSVGASVIVARLLSWGRDGASIRKGLAVAAAAVTVVATLALVSLVLSSLMVDREYTFGHAVFLPMVICMLVLAAVGLWRIRAGVAKGTSGDDHSPRVWLRIGLVSTALAATLLAGFSLVVGGYNSAVSVRLGFAEHMDFLGVRLTSWGAEAATLSWAAVPADRTLRPLAETCVMYLGESDGTVFVYRPDKGRGATFRIPAAIVTVRVLPGADCLGGAPYPSVATQP